MLTLTGLSAKTSATRLAWIGVALVASSSSGFSQNDGVGDEQDRVLAVPISGPLTARAAETLQTEINSHLEKGRFTTVVFRFDKGGGDVQPSEFLARYVFSELSQKGEGIRTVAWLPEINEPLGPTVLVALACKDLVLGRNAVLAAISEGSDDQLYGPTFRRKLEEYARYYRRPTLLARALVDTDHDDIKRVAFRKGASRQTVWEEHGTKIDFLEEKEFQLLDHPTKKVDVVGAAELVCARGQPLKIVADTARPWMFSQRQAAEDPTELLLSLNLSVPLENYVDMRQGAQRSSSPGGQAIVDFFKNPVVRVILILGGCLGLLIEIKMLGAMIPGVCGLACFLLLFFTSLLPFTPVAGSPAATATLFEILLFFIGFGLLAVEFLLLPGVAVFALIGGALCLVSLVLIMVPPESSPLRNDMTVKDAIWTLSMGFGSGAMIFVAILKFLPRSRLLSSGGLVTHSTIEGVPTADSALDAQIETTRLVGQTGLTDTMLRPAGKVLLDDGRLLDVVSGGEFIGPGEKVVVTGGSATRITVKKRPGAEPDSSPDSGPDS